MRKGQFKRFTHTDKKLRLKQCHGTYYICRFHVAESEPCFPSTPVSLKAKRKHIDPLKVPDVQVVSAVKGTGHPEMSSPAVKIVGVTQGTGQSEMSSPPLKIISVTHGTGQRSSSAGDSAELQVKGVTQGRRVMMRADGTVEETVVEKTRRQLKWDADNIVPPSPSPPQRQK